VWNAEIARSAAARAASVGTIAQGAGQETVLYQDKSN
jgi:hypothetical protein